MDLKCSNFLKHTNEPSKCSLHPLHIPTYLDHTYIHIISITCQIRFLYLKNYLIVRSAFIYIHYTCRKQNYNCKKNIDSWCTVGIINSKAYCHLLENYSRLLFYQDRFSYLWDKKHNLIWHPTLLLLHHLWEGPESGEIFNSWCMYCKSFLTQCNLMVLHRIWHLEQVVTGEIKVL